MENLVSIIIPAYNQARYLKFAITSILSQTYTLWECIVVDDGSTDNTAEQAKQFKHPKIRYIYQANAGLSAARNTGMEAAKGEYLTFLDADDRFEPQKLEILVDVLDKNPQLALVAGTASLIDENGNPIHRAFESRISKDCSDLLNGNPLHVGSVLLRRDWAAKIGQFDTNLRSYEDWDYWLRLALAGGKMKSIKQVVSNYRFHTAQMTRNTGQMTEASFSVLNKVFDNPELPADWLARKECAFSHANLRAAANAYLEQDFSAARTYLSEASRLNPELLNKNGALLTRKIIGWSELPKVKSPFSFLHNILTHLPDDVGSVLQKQRKKILSRYAIQKAFESYQNEDYNTSFHYVKRGIRQDWSWIFNRGVIKIFLMMQMNGKHKEIKPDYYSNDPVNHL